MLDILKLVSQEERGKHRCFFCGTDSGSVKYLTEINVDESIASHHPGLATDQHIIVYSCNLCVVTAHR